MEIILITGKVNSGKTSLIKKLVKKEKAAGSSPGGIIAPGVFKTGIKTGYDAEDLVSGNRTRLARRKKDGGFVFYKKGFELARKALNRHKDHKVMFLDEIGPLELAGQGHAKGLRALASSDLKRLYLVVRDSCLSRVKKKFLKRKGLIIRIKRVNKTV